jgi:hypothetical protein
MVNLRLRRSDLGPLLTEGDRFDDKTAIHQATVGLVVRHLGSRSSTSLETSGTAPAPVRRPPLKPLEPLPGARLG